MCVHLVGDNGQDLVVALLTGEGIEHDWCCQDCDKKRAAGQTIELIDACEGCIARIEDDQENPTAWRGQPGIRYRPEDVHARLTRTTLPADLASPLDFAPIPDHPGRWLVLTRDCALVVLDADTGETSPPLTIEVPPEPEPNKYKPPRLRVHCSSDGRFAAVVTDYGREGAVVDLGTRQITMRLDRGGYHPQQTPFPLAFVGGQDDHKVVHGTAWNRLDVSSAATGRLLSEREPTSYQRGEQRPTHDLDYFHGELHLSPTQRWIADDGWVWHPTGIPVAWNVRRWLSENVWESEDGPSRCRLAFRSYHWDVPMCWVGDTVLAISGIGNDDEAMLPGARIFDVETVRELLRFAGPSGAFFYDGGRLCSADKDGLALWDPTTGEQTGLIAGFHPTRHHPGGGGFAEIDGDTLIRWSTSKP